MRPTTVSFVLALVAGTVDAHITLWHPSLFGFNYPLQSTEGGKGNQAWNTNTMVTPLRHSDNLTTAEWFGHGAIKYPPAKGDFLELPAGESVTFELQCNRAFTSYRDPNIKRPLAEYACEEGFGPLHTAQKEGQPVNASNFGGTALAIAYTSDEKALKPSNMTVISVNATSPWTRLVTYRIPEGLPPCPEDGCLVTWNWIHLALNGEGYGPEIYNTLYRAKITGKTNKHNKVGTGSVPVKCESDRNNCVTGPKQPMYLWQKDGNNMEPVQAHVEQNPTYNMRYGYPDGAQDDAILFNVKDSSAGKAYAFSLAGVLGAVLVAVLPW